MSYFRNRGYGFGLELTRDGYPQPISTAPAPTTQPAGTISTQEMIQVNPMLPAEYLPGESASVDYTHGDQAMMLEMQQRASYPATFQQPVLEPALPTRTAPTEQPISPTQVTEPYQSGVCDFSKTSDSAVLELLIQFWKSIKAGQQPHRDLQEAMDCVMKTPSKQYLAAKSEGMVMGGGATIEAGIATTQVPGAAITAGGAPVTEPMPTHPVLAQSRPTAPITSMVESPNVPAQRVEPIEHPYPPASPGYDPGVAPITNREPPAYGPIPPGPGATAQIPQGQLPPTTQTYTTAPLLPPTSQSSSLLPIAIGAGALLLLWKLL